MRDMIYSLLHGRQMERLILGQLMRMEDTMTMD